MNVRAKALGYVCVAIKLSIITFAVFVLFLSACMPVFPSVTSNSTSSIAPVASTTVPISIPKPVLVTTPSPTLTPTPTPVPILSPVNQPPVIKYLNAPGEVQVSSTNTITCLASDPEQDLLSYSWSADAGKIFGNSENVQWVAPETAVGSTITVMVTDNHSPQVAKSVVIIVKSRPVLPPKIVSFIVYRKDNTIFDLTPITVIPNDVNQVSVERSSLTEINCFAEDPNGEAVSYIWSAPLGGEIIGTGSGVNYFSPSNPGDYFVTVTVINKSGSKSTASVQFYVPCCGLGAFGVKGK